MDPAIDRPAERKGAIIWGRLLYAVGAGFFVLSGVYPHDAVSRWINFLLAGIFVYEACTYRPSRVDKAVSEAMGLGWAVVLLVVMPLLTLALIFGLDGCNTATMWSVLLAGIIVPGWFVWRHFRSRKS